MEREVLAFLVILLAHTTVPCSAQCPSNCDCSVPGALVCRDFPDRFVPDVTNITLASVNATILDVRRLDANYGGKLNSLFLNNLGVSELLTSDSGFRLSSLATLQMSGNKLRRLAADTFRWCPGITLLVLSDNSLKDIAPDTFAELRNLRSLDLANNTLMNLDAVRLPTSLAVLDLGNNQLGEVPMFANDLPNLESLNLVGNDYGQVPSGIFDRLSKLSALGLGDGVTSIQNGSLSILGSLRTLKVTGKGDFNAIAGQEITKLRGLQRLDLSCFTFPSIGKTATRGLQSLQELRLVEIASTSGLERGALEPLRKLQLLDLTRSPVLASSLSMIQTPLPSLKSLLLSDTNVSAPDQHWFALAPKLESLDVSYNPISCDGKWKELLEAVLRGRLRLLNVAETVCTRPASLADRQLVDLSVVGEIAQDNGNATMPPESDGSGGIYYFLDRYGITTDDLLYTILALGIAVCLLIMVLLIVAYYKSKKCKRCCCRDSKEGSAENFMMRADSEYTFDNFTLSDTMAESRRGGTLSKNGRSPSSKN